MAIVLASQSPRRQELLARIGVEDFKTLSLDIDESYPEGLSPEDTVRYIAKKKCDAAAALCAPDDLIITADTMVFLGNDRLGKPRDEEDALRMLRALSGRAHTVCTGVSVRRGAQEERFAVSTRVFFRPMTDDEIRAYYEKHKDTMYDRNGLHMGLIVYNPNVNARSIAAQIASGSLSFEEAARKYSIAPNREKGGDMGPVEWGRLNPEWESRLEKMKPGDVTDIFTVQGHKAQVHLFRPGQSGPGRPMTFEEARPVIDNILRQPKAMERFDEYSQQLRNKAVIDIRL